MNVKYDCYITTSTQEREKSVNIKYLMIATIKNLMEYMIFRLVKGKWVT